MRCHADVIAAFGGPAGFAEAVGVTSGHARIMKFRNRIPSTYWRATADAAKRLRIRGVSVDVLSRLDAHARQTATRATGRTSQKLRVA